MNGLIELGKKAKAASRLLAAATTAQKNKALEAIAVAFESDKGAEILQANQTDLSAAKENGLSQALTDRLKLTPERLADISKGVREVAALPDPIGEIISGGTRPNGLKIEKIRTPLGVVAMIYEARPNVTADAAALCLKSSNACILRCGKEAIHSCMALEKVMREALEAVGLPQDCIQLIHDTSRQSAVDLMNLTSYVDVLIPRGGKGLIRSVAEQANVPVIETGAGNCHIYVDESAQIEMAVNICDNAKTSRPSVCNAVETVLVHSAVAPQFLPALQKALNVHHVELRGCPKTTALLPGIQAATEEDYATEYDDYILALRVVDSMEEAITHIQTYSTGHSEAIITENYSKAKAFTEQVDSAAVYVNASTRFTDGGEFGFGAEIGISTQKLHARGPMGLAELCSSKYIVTGNGQIR